MDREHFRTKREQFQRDIHRLSEEKNRQLFEREEDREAWVKVIRRSVEKEIESRVRQVLGTPPKERQRKRLEELTAQRLAKIEEEKRAMTSSILNSRSSLERISEEDKEFLLLRRQKYLEKFSRRRTMRAIPANFSRTTQRYATKIKLKDNDSYTSPIVWESFETVPTNLLEGKIQCKRGFSKDNVETDKSVLGPYFPSGRLPCMATPKHLQSIPTFVEGLNIPEENENTPKAAKHPAYPKCWKGSVIVFDTERKNTLDPDAVPPGCPPHLQFESRFECGNLRQARRIGNYDYELVLNTDLYTKRHTQWYYFQLRKTVPGVTYTFIIINLLKRDSLYNHGMKPLFYSEKTAEKQKIGWTRKGHHIKYFPNYIKRHPLLSRDCIYYSLTFQMEFPEVNDVCYLAHCYPYSYTDLEIYLKEIAAEPLKYRCCKQQVLCKTVAGNNCYLLTVTSEDSCDGKSGVVVTARVHPGETNASWMMKGLLDFLTSDDPVAENLRRKHVFKIIPMLNPDGVIVGNYRTNLAAKDLNRTYKNPEKETSPTAYHTKNLVESFSSKHEIVIYCDLHGHSRKPNIFMYGCTPDSRGTSVKDFVQERLFPWLMSKKAPDLFSFRECKFKVRKCKESTARVVMWRQMGVANSFTMEATFCGANFGDLAKGRHFHCGDFEAMGRHFCEVLMDYTTARPNGSRSEVTEAFLEMASCMTQDIARHARLLQLEKNEPCCSAKGRTKRVGDSRVMGAGEVNVFDVLVGEPRSAVEFQEVEVSVRKSTGVCLEDCFKQLDQLDLDALCAESDSSDSDSESEDEDDEINSSSKQSKKNEDRGKKKKKKKPMKRWEVLAALKNKPEIYAKGKEDQNNEKSNKEITRKKIKLNQGTFVNPYTTRYNNGIPIYSQERIEERLRKRTQDKSEEEDMDPEYNSLPVLRPDEHPGVETFAPDKAIFALSPQRNLACYVVSRGPRSLRVEPTSSLPGSSNAGKPHPLEVDTFKFEPLSDSTSKGFTVRIPERHELPLRRNDDELRLNHELSQYLPSTREEINSCIPACREENLGVRNTVSLNPLQHPQGSAFVYDLRELSRTGTECERAHVVRKDWDTKHGGVNDFVSSPTRRLRRISAESLHEPIPRSETKLRSLQKLRHMSLDEPMERSHDADPAHDR